MTVSLEQFRTLQARQDPATHNYLADNFDVLFAEAVSGFSLFGWLAIGLSAGAVLAACTCWYARRQQLPWRWLWLLPLVALSAYAATKCMVIFQLIEKADSLQAMWQMYFHTTTPLKMIRTSFTGLLILSAAMLLVAHWRQRKKNRARPENSGA